MPKKVYELAKELGVASKELLEKAAKLGIKVESHMSVLSDTDVKRLSAKGGAARPVGKAVPGQVSGRVGPVGRPIVNDSYFENKRKAPAGRPVVDDDFLARLLHGLVRRVGGLATTNRSCHKGRHGGGGQADQCTVPHASS